MTKRIDISLEKLHAMQLRVDVRQLHDDDWPVIDGLIGNFIIAAETRQRRMLEKIAADEANNLTADNIIDITPMVTPSAEGQTASSDESESTDRVPTDASPAGRDNQPPPAPDKKAGSKKGHGRNGAASFTKAANIIHRLKAGIIGAICKACLDCNVTNYRKKTTIHVTGQPLFSATVHHFEQGRCRNCGHIVRAEVPAEVTEGIGSSYIVYDWIACAMLAVMHYAGGLPFKRIDSLHAGWGIPFPDANQWKVVNACDDMLLPLLRALERYAIRHGITLRIDDTGSMVIELRREINAEIAELKKVGKNSDNVRTGINATCVYIDTEEGPIVLFYTGLHHAGEIIDQVLKFRASWGNVSEAAPSGKMRLNNS